jgi:hypothetical protein
MKLYFVMWASAYTPQWTCGPDNIYRSREMAELALKLQIMRHTNPDWRHALIECDAPELDASETVEHQS